MSINKNTFGDISKTRQYCGIHTRDTLRYAVAVVKACIENYFDFSRLPLTENQRTRMQPEKEDPV